MGYIREHLGFTQVATVVVSVTFLGACTSWHTTSVQPDRFRSGASPAQVRLILSDGTELRATDPVMTADSLVWVEAHGEVLGDSVRRAVSVADIRQIEVQNIDAGKTLLLALGVAAVADAIAYASGPAFSWKSR